MKLTKSHLVSVTAGLLASAYMAGAAANGTGGNVVDVKIGTDANSIENTVVQPQDPALSGGGRDQTLQFGDVLLGNRFDNLLIGRLGTDILAGGRRNDVMVGGTEHFNPLNRDRAFGGSGKDVFLWAPGDGSDFFNGGRGQDAVVFGLIREIVNGEPVFDVFTDQQAGDIFIDPKTSLPQVDVPNSPGFCEVIDRGTSPEAHDALKELDLDHLVRFSLRGKRDAFEAPKKEEDELDNGLRVTLHLKDVEVLVCTNRNGGQTELLDLTVSPPAPIGANDLRSSLRNRLRAMGIDI